MVKVGVTRESVQVKLLEPASSTRFRAAAHAADVADDFLVPLPDAEDEYASPRDKEALGGRELSMQVTIRPGSSGQRFEADLVAQDREVETHRRGDVVHITPASSAQGLQGASLWGAIQDHGDRTLQVAGFWPQALARRAARMEEVTIDATVTVFRRLDVPCDLHGLGMLLFRAVLVNDSQDISAVHEAVQAALEDGVEALRERIQAEEGPFEPGMILYGSQDRSTSVHGVPVGIWTDVLLLGFRLVSNVHGFSICEHHADFEPEKRQAVMNRVLEVLDDLNRRVHIELYGRAARDREVARACEDILLELVEEDTSESQEETRENAVEADS
jgi:hypothetical protein